MLYTLIKITHLLLICNTGRIVLKLVTLDLGLLNYIFRLHISNFCWHKWQTYVSEAVAWWPPGYLHFCIGTSVWHQGISERTMLIAWVKIFIIPCHPDCRGNGTIKWFFFFIVYALAARCIWMFPTFAGFGTAAGSHSVFDWLPRVGRNWSRSLQSSYLRGTFHCRFSADASCPVCREVLPVYSTECSSIWYVGSWHYRTLATNRCWRREVHLAKLLTYTRSHSLHVATS